MQPVAMAYSGTQISPGSKPVSPVSGLADDSLPTEPLGKQSVYMNKFGKTMLNSFLTVWHPLSLGSGEFLQI